jgi:uncharacterized protein YqjF (DUF2071 family)
VAPDDQKRLEARELPHRIPVMYQEWQNLLFLHWTWDAAEIQKTLPPSLFVDTFEKKAYLGIVPFFMRKVRPIGFPSIPYLSNFLELNVRTYVYDEFGRPGVWFYSLDCNRVFAAIEARLFFHLPYFLAKMRSMNDKGKICFSSKRSTNQVTQFEYSQESIGHRATIGSLEFFLIERYFLFAYARRKKKLYIGQIHHSPYLLMNTAVDRWDDEMLPMNGFPSPQRSPDHIIFSPGVKVDIFLPQRIHSIKKP